MHLVNRSKALFTALSLALVALLSPAIALAAPAAPSVTGVVDYIESLAVPIGLVGAAVLILALGVKAYKWIRRAM
jgi:hypothetical protein